MPAQTKPNRLLLADDIAKLESLSSKFVTDKRELGRFRVELCVGTEFTRRVLPKWLPSAEARVGRQGKSKKKDEMR